MRLIQSAKNIIKRNDIFNSPQLLRYEKDSTYKTYTGGILSILLYATIIISFFFNIGDTLNKNIISFTSTIINQQHAHQVSYTLGKDQFMFAIKMANYVNLDILDLNTNYKFFEVQAIQVSGKYGQNLQYNPIPLVPCTLEHWALFPQIQKKYFQNKMDKMLCPILGSNITLEGGISTSITQVLYINIVACKNQYHLPYVCANQSQIDMFLNQIANIQVEVLFTNSILNLNQKDFKKIALFQGAIAYFSKQIGASTNIFLSDYSINSDNSYMPYSDLQVTHGTIIIITPQPTVYYRPNNTQSYARFIFVKCPNYLVYDRNTQKLSTLFSYIGGFFGAFMTALFFFKYFVQESYEVEQIKNFYKLSQQKPFKFIENFHIFKFIPLKLYQLIKYIGMKCEWKVADQYIEFRQQILHQLDVSYLIKRVINLERIVSNIYQTSKFKNLSLDFNHINQIKIKDGIHYQSKKVIEQSQLGDKQDTNMQMSIKADPPIVFQQIQSQITENKQKGKIQNDKMKAYKPIVIKKQLKASNEEKKITFLVNKRKNTKQQTQEVPCLITNKTQSKNKTQKSQKNIQKDY